VKRRWRMPKKEKAEM